MIFPISIVDFKDIPGGNTNLSLGIIEQNLVLFHDYEVVPHEQYLH